MLFSCDPVWDSVPNCFPFGQDSHENNNGQDSHENNIPCSLYNIVQ